jgi:hypothetical protein
MRQVWSVVMAVTLVFATLALPPTAHAVVDSVPPSSAEVEFTVDVNGCTGSLIHPNWVLTAASCTTLGVVRVGNQIRGQGGTVHEVAEVRRNPSYPGTDGHDIALLKLATPSFRTRVKLAPPSMQEHWDGVGNDYASVLGWGRTADGGSLTQTLARGDVTIDREVSTHAMDSALWIYHNRPGPGPCDGDLGGPLVIRLYNQPYQIGVTHYGDCAGFAWYVKVATGPNRVWIESQIPDLDNPVPVDYTPTPPPFANGPTDTTKPAFLYGVRAAPNHPNVRLLTCYRHNGYLTGAGLGTAGAWQYGVRFAGGFLGTRFFSGAGLIYELTPEDRLMPMRHNDAATCGPDLTYSDEQDRQFLAYPTVFAMASTDPNAGNPIYAIDTNGDLRWFDHRCHAQPTTTPSTPGCWTGGHVVGIGWQHFQHVFPGGNGIIYAVRDDGTLVWYRHHAYLTGGTWPGDWEGPYEVNSGFGGYLKVMSVGDGVIYAIRADGVLLWYRHHGYESALHKRWPGAWEGPYSIGIGWNTFEDVILLSPAPPKTLR